MTAHAPDFSRDARPLGAEDALVLRFEAVLSASRVVAGLAGVDASRDSDALADALRSAPAWKRDLAADQIADMAAVMEPGIATLLAVSSRGADPRCAARALWAEHEAACGILAGLLRD